MAMAQFENLGIRRSLRLLFIEYKNRDYKRQYKREIDVMRLYSESLCDFHFFWLIMRSIIIQGFE
jgi:hypothetical protein